MTTEEEEKGNYFDALIAQGDTSICPECFRNNRTRRRCCKNAVLLMPQEVLVCCYLGDKNDITEAQFNRKCAELVSSSAQASGPRGGVGGEAADS
jgi:hypothetical protein